MLTSTREAVRQLLTQAVRSAVRDGELARVPIWIAVERPRQFGHGDFAMNVALLLAKGSGTRRPQKVHGDTILPRGLLGVSTPEAMAKTENLTKEDES